MSGFTDSNGIYRDTVQAYKEVPLVGWLAAGTALAAFADGASATPGLAVVDSESVGVRWNNHATPAAVFTKVLVPEDKKPNSDVIVHVVCSKVGATVGDATTFTIGAFFNTVGALHDADANAGGATGAVTGDAASKTIQKVTRTIAAADVPNPTSAAPSVLALSYKPTDGTLGTDDIVVQAVYLEYTKIVNP